jgi:hypothetical protein
VPEQLKGLHEAANRATEAIEGCYHNDVYSASPDCRHQLIESLRTIGSSRHAFIDVLGSLIPSSGTAVFT